MKKREVGATIRIAANLMNEFTQEVEAFFAEFSRLLGDDPGRYWSPRGRVYGREVVEAPGGFRRRLPQTLYRLFLPVEPGSQGRRRQGIGEGEEDEKVHVALTNSTRILVVAVVLYGRRSELYEPQLVAGILRDFVTEKWKGAGGKPGGLRKKHLKALVEEVDLELVNRSASIKPISVDGGRLGCKLQVLDHRPVVSITGGEAVAKYWDQLKKRLDSKTSD